MSELINAGRFRAKPTCWGLVERGENKVAKFAVEFEILAGEHEDEECLDRGRMITWFGGFDGGGLKFTTKAMRACGWDGETDPSSDALRLENEVWLVIEHREHEGKTYPEVKYINALDDTGTGGAPGYLIEKLRMDPARARDFGRELLARMKGAAPAAPAAPAARPAPAPAQAGPRPGPAPAPAGTRPMSPPAARPAPARAPARPAPAKQQAQQQAAQEFMDAPLRDDAPPF